MFDWLAEQYITLVMNFKILLRNPSGCYAVNYLQLFTLTLLVVVAAKLVIHFVVVYRLKRRYPKYSQTERPALFRLVRDAVREVGLRRTPGLFRFADETPLGFTLGVWKPAVFLAPRLVEALPESELKAALVHELTHIKRHDYLRIWLLEIFFALVPALIIQLFALAFIFNGPNSRLALLGALLGMILFKLFLRNWVLSARERSCDDLTVEVTRDPLTLASSLISVWRLGRKLPKHRWQLGPAFAHSLWPSRSGLEARVRRLIEYRRPWFKFFLGKVVRVAAVASILLAVAFGSYFHSTDRLTSWHVDINPDGAASFHSGPCHQQCKVELHW